MFNSSLPDEAGPRGTGPEDKCFAFSREVRDRDVEIERERRRERDEDGRRKRDRGGRREQGKKE